MSQDEHGTGHEQPTELQDSNPNAGGPERAEGGMGISSERVGPTGPGQESTDGERDTRPPEESAGDVDHVGDHIGAKAGTPQSSAGEPEQHPDPGIPPKAGYPSKDPRSADHPYKDA